jgi:hypothetical protein
MFIEKLFFFLDDPVNFFMECQELLRVNHVISTASATALTETTDSLALISTCSQSILEIVPIFLFLLL